MLKEGRDGNPIFPAYRIPRIPDSKLSLFKRIKEIFIELKKNIFWGNQILNDAVILSLSEN